MKESKTKEEKEAKREFHKFLWRWAKYFFLPIIVIWVLGWYWLYKDEETRAVQLDVLYWQTKASLKYQDSIESFRETPRKVKMRTLTSQDSLELRMEGMQNKR